MKLGSYIYFNNELTKVIFANKKVTLKNKRIGKVSKIYIKNGQLWIDIKIDIKKFKNIIKRE